MDQVEVKKTTRNTVLEILRVIAMLMIFFHHAIAHGGTSFWSTYDFQDYLRESIYHLGKLGVVIYVLISGYCLVDSKFSWKKLLVMILEVLLFSIGFSIYYLISNPQEISYKIIRDILLPFSNDTYWFMSQYLILYLFSPLINLALKTYGKKFHLISIGVLFVLSSFLASILNKGTYEAYILIFTLIYLIGAYFKLYPLNNIKWQKYLILLGAISLYALMNYALIKYGKDGVLKNHINRLYGNANSPLNLLIGTGLFVFFISIKPFYNKWVNILLSGTLEIYLIHDNPYFRKDIFSLVYSAKDIPHSNTWALEFIGVTLIRFIAVFVVALLIKLLYSYIIKLIFTKSSKKSINN